MYIVKPTTNNSSKKALNLGLIQKKTLPKINCLLNNFAKKFNIKIY